MSLEEVQEEAEWLQYLREDEIEKLKVAALIRIVEKLEQIRNLIDEATCDPELLAEIKKGSW